MTGVALTLALGLRLAFAASGLGLGMLLPGETAVVVPAATMRSGPETVVLGIAVMVGATLGAMTAISCAGVAAIRYAKPPSCDISGES